MINKKNIFIHFISFAILVVGFILCRYVFFDIHRMKDWSNFLFIIGLVVLIISFFTKAKYIPIFTSLAYIVGFVIGVVFEWYGINKDLWLIWIVVFICHIIFSIISEIISKKKRNLIKIYIAIFILSILSAIILTICFKNHVGDI